MLIPLFGSIARIKVLALFMLNPASEFYLREISQRTGLPVRAVERTTKALLEIGLLRRESRGNNVYFSVNRKFPILPELKAIFLKTVGLGDRLREALSEQEDIEVAFIYGSVARDEEDLESDIDLFVVGEATLHSLTPVLSQMEDELGREINATVFSEEELSERVKRNDHFVKSVLAAPKIFLLGDEEALQSVVRV